ncbi:MAG: hypothetical protein PHT12_04165 [Patescibacteria group bacterium]|nr:hypothetical protein [Patescibacteria group bacterium]
MSENTPTPAAPKTTKPEPDRLIPALSYVGVLFLIPLLTAKDDEFAQFHAKQGLVLFVVDVAVSIVAWIPLVGWSLAIACVIVSVYGFLQAMAGVKWEMPYLGQYAKQIKM